VKLTIDGVAVEVPKGTGLVEAALAAGIEIPVFCYEPRLGAPVGACRMCLCQVEPGPPKPQAACTLTAQEGMVVRTALTSAVAAEAQNATLEFILVNHPLDCPVCDKGGECPLQDYSYTFGPDRSRTGFARRVFDGEGARAEVDFGPTLFLNRNRCILCTRCVRFMRDIHGEAQIEIANLHTALEASLLPATPLSHPTLTILTAYRPGEERLRLGGDFFDIQPIAGDGLALIIGDVSGHGPQAAALGARLRAAWQGLVLAGSRRSAPGSTRAPPCGGGRSSRRRERERRRWPRTAEATATSLDASTSNTATSVLG
jgi:ferredoxin